MATKETVLNELIVQEFKTFWQKIDSLGGSIYNVQNKDFVNTLRMNFHEVHHAELNTEERKYYSSDNGQPVTMGYAFSIHDLLEIIGLDYEVYETNKKQVEGHDCKGIQICFGHNHIVENGVKTINTERLELIMRPLLYEANDKPMVELENGTHWSTAPLMKINEVDCPPPLDHCKPVTVA